MSLTVDHVSVRIDGDTPIKVNASIPGGRVHVHVGVNALLISGSMADLERLVVEIDRDLARLRTSDADGERLAQHAADLRALSGEHAAITEENER
jgi:hypothetical protein